MPGGARATSESHVADETLPRCAAISIRSLNRQCRGSLLPRPKCCILRRVKTNHPQVDRRRIASMNRRQRRAEKASRPSPPSNSGVTKPAAVLSEAGFRNLREGRLVEAERCALEALQVDPNHADALHLKALLAFHAQQFEGAVAWMSRALQQSVKPEYLLTLATALQQQKSFGDALKAIELALQLKPDTAGLWTSRGDILSQLDRSEDALASFHRALELQPNNWETANKCAILAHTLGQLESALAYADRCVSLRTDYAPSLNQRAVCLSSLKRFKEALTAVIQAHEADPVNAEICKNVGAIYQSLGNDERSIEWFDKALALKPNLKSASYNKAIALIGIRQLDDALAVYASLKADPDETLAHIAVAHLHLLMGNFEAGWNLREARWNGSISTTYPKLPKPMWLGEEEIAGKTVLVVADEGLGDTLQFARYVPLLIERGVRVVLVVQDALYPLLSHLPGVAQCIPNSATHTLPDYDFHCPIMSLPLAFHTTVATVPNAVPYLPLPHRDRVRIWEERLGDVGKPKIGLVWSGNPKHNNDHKRSIPLRLFSSILELDAVFVSLNPKPTDRELLQETDIVDLTAHLTDFAETTALVSCLDLIVTVDTSVAHLSGALGRPTWILLPYTPDYRWMLNRDDSPWYPTARLFRQDEMRDYATVLARVRDEMATQFKPARSVDEDSLPA
jgi:tetratricopeptide (TPR) repeat protein